MKFVDDGEGLIWSTAAAATTTSHSIDEVDGEWWVRDADGEVVGEWDTEEEAIEHVRVLEEESES